MLRPMFRTTSPWVFFGDFDRQLETAVKELVRPFEGPRIHLQETDDGLRLVAEVPGLGPEDIDVSATRDTLTIKGARKVDVPQDKKALRRERTAITFDTTYRFERPIDPDKVTAKVENGLLTLTAPPAPELQPKRIAITAR